MIVVFLIVWSGAVAIVAGSVGVVFGAVLAAAGGEEDRRRNEWLEGELEEARNLARAADAQGYMRGRADERRAGC